MNEQGETRSDERADGSCDQGEARRLLTAFLDSYDELFLLTGPAASGKTSLLAEALRALDTAHPLILVDAARLPQDGLINTLCKQLDLDSGSSDWEQTLDRISARLKPYEHTFLVVDNAHHLSESHIEDLRLLSYLRCGRGPQLQMVLAGRETLAQRIDASDMARLGLWHIRRARLRGGASASPGRVTPAVSGKAQQAVPLHRGEGQLQNVAAMPLADTDSRGELELLVPRAPLPPEPALTVIEGSALTLTEKVATVSGAPPLGWRNGPLLVTVFCLVPALLAAGYWLGASRNEASPGVASAVTVSGVPPASAVTGTPVVSMPAPVSEMNTGSPALAARNPALMPQVPPVNVTFTTLFPPQTEALSGLQLLMRPAGSYFAAGTEVPDGMEAVETSVSDDPDPAAAVAELLGAAAEAMGRDRLRTPADSSAWNYYNQVLALAPDNLEAQRGMQSIARRYEALTRLAIERGRLGPAQTYIDRGLRVIPDDAGLFAVQVELEDAIARKFAEEREAAQRLVATQESEPEPEAPAQPGGLIGFFKNVFSPQADESN